MNDDPFYWAGPVKRRRRTAEQTAQFEQQISDALEEDHPQSVRHVYYLMTNGRLPEPVEKTDKGYRQVQERTVKMRRAGTIPYSWVTDLSRLGYHTNTFSTCGDFLRTMRGLYRGDLWKYSPYYCEVWCESRSAASVIRDDCREYAVSLYPCGGFAGISFVHEAAQEINSHDNPKPIIIFYIGDYDPAGILIDVALEAELRRHLDPDRKIVFRRLAITPEQIARYDLPSKPRNQNDLRAPHIQETVEVEAMPAHLLRDLLRENIEALLPPDALAITQAAEDSERDFLSQLAVLSDQADADRDKREDDEDQADDGSES